MYYLIRNGWAYIKNSKKKSKWGQSKEMLTVQEDNIYFKLGHCNFDNQHILKQ